jgi:hypothetical protein
MSTHVGNGEMDGINHVCPGASSSSMWYSGYVYIVFESLAKRAQVLDEKESRNLLLLQ